MPDFRSVRLSEIGRVVTGRTPPSARPELLGDGVAFITPTDISEASIYPIVERRLSQAGEAEFRSILLPSNSVCFTSIASIGKMCLAAEPSITNQQINSIVVDQDRFDPRWVFHALRAERGRIALLASGSATPIINKTSFSAVELQAPSLSVQRRTASILGAYDELIEVNRRRIALLEEMARRLFAEWITHERVPDSADVSFNNVMLGEVADVRWGDTQTTKQSYVQDGYTAFSASGPDGYLDHYDHEGLGIVLSAIGAQCGKIWLADGRWSCIKNTIYIKAIPNRATTRVLALALSDPKFWPRRGAAQPFISQGDARRVVLRLPPLDWQQRLDQSVAPLQQHVRSLHRTNVVLAQSRDLLAPRLLSGELSASSGERELGAAA
jgi:type I restriction enzyme S subunit